MSEGLGPRATFAEWFALLHAEAGNPPLKQVTGSVARARRAVGTRGEPARVSVQRLSDWRRGRNVPARFGVLASVLEVLIGQARKNRPRAIVAGLYDLAVWRSLWEAAQADPVVGAGAGSLVGPVETSPNGRSAAAKVSNVCPYQGLASFGRDDAAWFFGRAQATNALLARLAGAVRAGGMVTLVGASGSGKSSLLRAGLMPSLARGALSVEGSAEWPLVLMVPGADPVKELADRLPCLADVLRAAVEAAAVQRPDSPDGPATAGLDEFAARARAELAMFAGRHAGPERRVVIVVDQFEETFALCGDEIRRRAFIKVLHAACTPAAAGGGAPGLVILGMRADFYGRYLEHRELAAALQDWQMVLEPMTAAELREVIIAPANAVGVRPEPGLVELVLRDLDIGADPRRGCDAGVLPLLSHALLETWRRRHAGKLTVAGYRAAGGIQGSVAATAERAWAQLGPDGQMAARALLLRLVQIGEDTQDTRRRAVREDLLTQAADRAATEDVLELLAGQRLITLDTQTVEISHETLLWAWPRMRRWLDQDRAGSLARQRLEEDARTWRRHDRDSALLYRGAPLMTVRHQALAGGTVGLTKAAQEFLATSVRHQRRSAWARRTAVAMVGVFAVIAVGAAVLAVRQRDEAIFRQVVAEADRASATDQSLSAQLNLVAHRIRPHDMEVNARLISTQNTPLATPLTGHSGAVYLTSFSPDGRLLATASYDNTARLWDVHVRTHPVPLGAPLIGHTSWVTSAVFDPGGHTLATAGDDGTIRLWNITDPAHPVALGKPLTGRHGTIYLVAFSPDGRTLAAANEDHTTRLWNVGDPARPTPLGKPLTGHTAAVRSLAFSPDGRVLATTGDDKRIRLWNVSDPAHPLAYSRPLTGHRALVHSVAFSPDGRLLASTGNDKTIRLWDVADPARATPLGPPLSGHDGPIWSVKFGPDGRTLATGSVDSTTRLWNLADPATATQLGQPLTARTGIVFAVDFSPDGRTLATGSADGAVHLWSLPPKDLTGHNASVARLAISPDGRTLATASDDQTIRLWNIDDASHPAPLGRPLIAHTGPTYWVAFSPDGRMLATTSKDRTIRLWNVTDPAMPEPLGRPIPADNRYTAPVAFSPDGRTLATIGDDKTIRLWNIRDPRHPAVLGRPLTGHTGYINSVAFSPDGHMLASASSDKTVRLWNTVDPARRTAIGGPLTGHGGPIQQAVFSPDGRMLATASDDKTIQLWDIRESNRPVRHGRPLAGHTESVNSVAFSPDGRTIATGSYDKTVRLWKLTGPSKLTSPGLALTGHTAGVRSVAFSPDPTILATASTDGTVRLWDLDSEHAIQRICTATRGVLTYQQWHRHIPQRRYDPPCH